MAFGKRTQDYRYLRDTRRSCPRKIGLLVLPVTHPEHPDWPLWLLVSRQGQGRSPWYLLTNDPITTLDEGWQRVLAYARRWQIEQTWRFSKSELAMESPHVWRWADRRKLLLMASLACAFLLLLLRQWCHRTGQRLRQVRLPLYRLRSALSRLWLAHAPPSLDFALLNSG